jgi:hypothetical protein
MKIKLNLNTDELQCESANWLRDFFTLLVEGSKLFHESNSVRFRGYCGFGKVKKRFSKDHEDPFLLEFTEDALSALNINSHKEYIAYLLKNIVPEVKRVCKLNNIDFVSHKNYIPGKRQATLYVTPSKETYLKGPKLLHG